ncbi:MAG: histidine phosphatase family protein [Lachnospiraceae bacterium]|nr:histidine phosphatase family protein [Lachnospiraceae bacterium]
MNIYLIRHGETDFNKEGRYVGKTDLPLSKEGREYLTKADFDIERVYVSNLKRTAETAKVMFPNAKSLPVEDIREMDFGDFEGKNAEEMKEDKAYRDWVDNDCLPRCPNGESKDEFSERVCRGFENIFTKEREKGSDKLVAVVHGGTIMAFMEKFALPRKPYYEWIPGNAEGYLLELKDGDDMRNCVLKGHLAYHKENAPKNIHEM